MAVRNVCAESTSAIPTFEAALREEHEIVHEAHRLQRGEVYTERAPPAPPTSEGHATGVHEHFLDALFNSEASLAAQLDLLQRFQV